MIVKNKMKFIFYFCVYSLTLLIDRHNINECYEIREYNRKYVCTRTYNYGQFCTGCTLMTMAEKHSNHGKASIKADAFKLLLITTTCVRVLRATSVYNNKYLYCFNSVVCN